MACVEFVPTMGHLATVDDDLVSSSAWIGWVVLRPFICVDLPDRITYIYDNGRTAEIAGQARFGKASYYNNI